MKDAADRPAKTGAVPRHVAIIMDGNGRWANARSMPRHAGHKSGVKSVRQAVEFAAEQGISYLTLFAFSSENWGRPREEVNSLMRLFLEALQREVDELHRNNVRLTFIGERDKLQRGLVEKIAAAEQRTRENQGLRLIIAVAYGGRWDIVNAARKLVARVAEGSLAAADVGEKEFAQSLELGCIPDPDLLIRTGGENRVSNFLLWNLAYAELYFTDCLWPDFGKAEFAAAVDYFAGRQRRYGHSVDKVGAA